MCAHTAVGRRDAQTAFVAKPIENECVRMGADLGSEADCACAMKTLTVTGRSAFANGRAW